MRRLGFILFILIIVYFIFLIRQDIIGNLELKKELKTAVKNLKYEDDLGNRLQHKLKLLESKKYIEELARTRLGMIKIGETAYKVVFE